MSGCQAAHSVDRLRTEFLALRYVSMAEAALSEEPADSAKAVRSLDQALALAPEHKLVLARAGRLYMIAEAYEQAIPLLLEARHVTGHDYHYELGTCYLYSADTRRGIVHLEAALKISHPRDQQDPLSNLNYALVLNNIGYTYADAGVNLPRAKQLITAAWRLAPLTASFIDSLGWVYFRLGDYHDAAFYLERAVRQSLDRPNAEIHYHLGATYARLHRRAQARQQLAKALRLRPNYPDALAALDELRPVAPLVPEPLDELRRQQLLSPPWRASRPELTSVGA